MMEKYRALRYPPVVFWELTDLCNHNCIHCFNYWRTDQQALSCSVQKTQEQYLTIAEKILEQKPVRVIFTGGEPLIAFKQLVPALKLLGQNKINLSFNSNAALLTEEIASFFAENRIGLFISFPSCRPEEFDKIVNTPGAFQKVHDALELAKKYQLFYSFNMVVSKVNLQSIFDTAKYLKEHYGIQRFSITRVSTPINAIDCFDRYALSAQDFERYMAQCVRVRQELNISVSAASPLTPCSITSQQAYDLFAFEGGCEAGKTSYVLGANGKVRACARDFEEYGDFMTEPFETIWERMAPWRDDRFIPGECKDCSLKSRCRGGCRVDGIIKTGKRNCLDNFSDLSRLPVAFEKAQPYLPTWEYSTVFAVPPSIQAVSEDCAVRLSYRSGYVYCTPQFSQYLLSTPAFTLDAFCRKFDLTMDTAKGVLNHLYTNGIIHIK